MKKENNDFDKLCKTALDSRINPGAEHRIQAALEDELDKTAFSSVRAVMTITEIADYLRVTPEVIESYLGEIPCFEFGGQLRFRKESVDEWISKKENTYKVDVMEFKLNQDIKITIA